MVTMHLVVFGLGYTGSEIARLAAEAGAAVTGTSRTPERVRAPPGVRVVAFEEAGAALREATHVLETAAPGEEGDPVLRRFGGGLGSAGLGGDVVDDGRLWGPGGGMGG